jgi:hypothetical protein
VRFDVGTVARMAKVPVWVMVGYLEFVLPCAWSTGRSAARLWAAWYQGWGRLAQSTVCAVDSKPATGAGVAFLGSGFGWGRTAMRRYLCSCVRLLAAAFGMGSGRLLWC